MGANSKISWTDHTFNPWVGCSKVSPACKNCYAEAWAKRSGLVQWGDSAERRRTSETNWRQPLKWNKEAQKAGERRRVFCASLADVFEDREELAPWRADLFRLIRGTPHLDWQLLTKRPENWIAHLNAALIQFDSEDDTEMIRFISGWLTGSWVPANVRIGTTVENQEMADKRIPELLKIPARVRFLSCEPLLGPIDFTAIGYPHPLLRWHCRNCDARVICATCPVCGYASERIGAIDWIIVGGESGPHARTMQIQWARDLRNQCVAANVPFFMKQMTQKALIPDDLMIREFPNVMF